MRSNRLMTLTVLACCAVASSCASRVETQKTFPSVADIKPTPEPAYPTEALHDAAIEQAWWNLVLIWGRDEHAKVVRVCNWAHDLKMPLPSGYCGGS